MIETYAHRTLRWGPIAFKGEDYPHSLDNARALYRNSRVILNQVDAFIQEEANFFPNSWMN